MSQIKQPEGSEVFNQVRNSTENQSMLAEANVRNIHNFLQHSAKPNNESGNFFKGCPSLHRPSARPESFGRHQEEELEAARLRIQAHR